MDSSPIFPIEDIKSPFVSQRFQGLGKIDSYAESGYSYSDIDSISDLTQLRDVDGGLNNRENWIYGLANCEALLFVTALDDYCKQSYVILYAYACVSVVY